MSRVGKKPITIPEKVKVNIRQNTAEVTGPLGNLKYEFPSEITIVQDQNSIRLTCAKEGNDAKAIYGLCRAILANMINGVNTGFKKELEIRGIGFKAQVQGNQLSLQLGYTHPVNLEIPQGIKVNIEDQTKITIIGADKYLVGEFANKIRSTRIPEPYKGTGIRYLGEYVRKKIGKAGAAAGAGVGVAGAGAGVGGK